jgi:hypothetical protein
MSRSGDQADQPLNIGMTMWIVFPLLLAVPGYGVKAPARCRILLTWRGTERRRPNGVKYSLMEQPHV